MVRNECFRVALDYLYKNGYVVDQNELSEKTGISATSISRILNNRVKEPSESTIRKLNDAFGNIFNPQYFRGQSVHLLLEDAGYYALHPKEDVSSKSYVPFDKRSTEKPSEEIPSWADTFISILSKQVVENEALNRQLKSELAEVRTLRAELQQAITAFRIIQHGKVAPYSPYIPEYQQAAEPNE